MNLRKLVNPKFLTGFTFLLTILFSCNPKPVNNRGVTENKSLPNQVFKLIAPRQDFLIIRSQQIDIQINSTVKEVVPDSTYIYIGGDRLMVQTDSAFSFSIAANAKKVGKQNLRIVIYYSDSLSQNLNCQVTVLSELKPVTLKYELIRTLQHDKTSYTQGLIFKDQAIYEGTGKNGNSKLRKIDPKNGQILKELKLDDEFFGEGITIFNNKIYQLTYRSKIGFIYDYQTFEVIRKFDLQTVEGWGLTNDSTNLISSDGSSLLYFYDPEYLTQVDQLDVCNNKGPVTNLNELEYINGFIWANIYGEPYIVKIDAYTGSVTGILNLQNLFPEGIPLDIDHVLNGIAYNKDSNTFYITGKFWPVMHEIKVFE